MSAFAKGFEAVTGRRPTQADYDEIERRKDRRFKAQYPDEPSTFEKVAAYGAPLLGAYITQSALSDGPTIVGDAARSIGQSLFGSSAGSTAATGTGVTIPGSVGVPETTSSLGLGTLGTGLGLAAGAYGLYNLGDSLSEQGEYQMDSDDLLKSTGGNALSGAAAGAALGSVIPGIGTVTGALIGGLFGGGASAGLNVFGSGKSQDQIARDGFRQTGINSGVFDNDYMVNGVDLGLDGGFKFDDGRRIFEIANANEDGTVNFTDEQSEAIGMLNPLGSFLTGGDDKYGNQFTSMLVNAAQEGGDPGISNAEIRQMYDRTGLGQAEIFEGINEMHRMGRISESEALAQQNAINQLYGQEYYSPEEDERQASIGRFRDTFFG